MIGVLLFTLLQAAPKEEVVDVPGEPLKIPLVHVPVEGSELRPYALAKFETTWKDFALFYREDSQEKRIIDGITRPSMGKAFFGQVQTPAHLLEEKKPAINMTWHSAMAYCDFLTANTGRKFRLPTQAEWERAARAGDAGAAPRELKATSHFGAESTLPPGKLKANAWGLHDMLGNVWEVALEQRHFGALKAVYLGGAWTSTEADLAYATRQPVKAEWFAADPNRPRSVWWLTSEFCQGFRVAAVDGPDALAASRAYAPKIGVKALKHAEKVVPLSKEEREKVESKGPELFRALTLEVVNRGDRVVEELELLAYFLTPKGEPHLLEREGLNKPNRPNFTWAHPVLASSAHAAARAPLGPGESRVFEIDVPDTTDDPRYVDPQALGARVTWVRLK